METDVRGAIEVGMQACLVLTGSTRREDLVDYVYQPTCVMSGVDELLAEIQGIGSTARITGSTYQVSIAAGQLADRHHSEHPLRSRPRPAMTR
jgi:NagD protein